jgi:hypothetical protein
MLSHDDFEAADREYYASPERAGLTPDVARHLTRVDTTLLHAVPVPEER